MRRLTLSLLLLSACKTVQVPVGLGTAPGVTVMASSGAGADSPRAAVETYLAAAKAQDLQALTTVWGDERGSIRNTAPREDVEKRAIIVSCFLKTTSATVGEPSRSEGARLMLPTQLTQGKATANPKFTVTQGPGSRWFVVDFDMTMLQNKGFCPPNSK